MTTISTPPARFIGCDVGKASVTVFDSADGTTRTIPNRAPNLRRLAAQLAPDCLVVCEATGRIERLLVLRIEQRNHERVGLLDAGVAEMSDQFGDLAP